MTEFFAAPQSVHTGADTSLDQDNSFDMSNRYLDENTALADINKDIYEVFVEDPVVVANIRKLEARSQRGMLAYGTSMEDNPASSLEWIDHAIEEALDLANYLEKLKRELNKRGIP